MTPKEVVKKFVTLFNSADAGGLAELYAGDAVNHQVANAPVAGKAAIKAMFEAEFAAAEMVCIAENIFADGEWGMLEWRDPKGLRGCGFFHIVDGKIVFQRGYWDKLSFLAQNPPEERTIRRSACAITDFATIAEIVRGNNSAVLSMVDGVTPYGVMMNYAPVFDGEELRLIFHGAASGRKTDCLKNNPAVSVFINDAAKTQIVDAGSESARWTTRYRSVVLAGEVCFAAGLSEKQRMAEAFMRHYTAGEIRLPDAALNAAAFFAFTARHVSGKQNQ